MRTLITILLLLSTGLVFAEKRIIRDIPIEMHLAGQAVIYDGLEDFIAPDDYDHTQPGTKYASENKPVFEEIDGERVKVSDETVLVPVHSSVYKRNTFAGWEAVGKDVEE